MAYEAITLETQGKNVEHRQTAIPNFVKGTVALDDDNHHYLVVDGRGKRSMTVAVINETDQTVTVTVFGAHNKTDTPESAQVFELGQDAGDSQFAVTTASKGYECYHDPFPYFIIDVVPGASADGKDVTILVDLLST